MKTVKKILSLCISLVFVLVLPLSLHAADAGRSYRFALASNGQTTVNVATGDILTVTLTLERTDSADAADMYAMQDEIQYDPAFFRLVDGSLVLGSGIESTVLGMRDGRSRLYLNYLSLAGGTSWQASTVVGSFQLEVIAESGMSSVTNENYLVSTPNGLDSFQAESVGLTIVASTDVLVNFESNGGSEVPDQVVVYGETLEEPQDPTRDDMYFAGWYRDLDRTTAWDFEEDTVSENTTLFADWSDTVAIDSEPVPMAEGSWITNLWWLWMSLGLAVLLAAAFVFLVLPRRRPTVVFETGGGSPVDKLKVKKGSKAARPTDPVKPGVVFAGWHKDKAGVSRWDFDADVVSKNTTLYSKWAAEDSLPPDGGAVCAEPAPSDPS